MRPYLLGRCGARGTRVKKEMYKRNERNCLGLGWVGVDWGKGREKVIL